MRQTQANGIETAFNEIFEQPVANPDENKKRYGMSFLINIPLYKHVGNAMFLRANPHENGRDITNTMYFPRFMLMPFSRLTVDVPGELPSSRTAAGSYETYAREFNPNAAESSADFMTSITKSPRQCADLFLNNYRRTGGCVFDSLMGIETYAEAKKDFFDILPLHNPEFFPAGRRIINSEIFLSPFLDEVLDFLNNKAEKRIESMPFVKAERKEHLFNLFGEILEAATEAMRFATSTISETEAAIMASPQEKKGYDIKNSRMYADAPESLDLLCLAQMNEKPKNERALESARILQSRADEPMVKAANAMVRMAESLSDSGHRQSADSSMTREEMKALLGDIREELRVELKAELAAELVAELGAA